MQYIDASTAAALLADPGLPQETLQAVAAEHPALWPLVLQHPRVYPELVQWINQQTLATTVQSDLGQVVVPERHESRGRRRWVLPTTISAALATVALVVSAGFWFGFGGPGDTMMRALEVFPVEDPGFFTVTLYDAERAGVAG